MIFAEYAALCRAMSLRHAATTHKWDADQLTLALINRAARFDWSESEVAEIVQQLNAHGFAINHHAIDVQSPLQSSLDRGV